MLKKTNSRRVAVLGAALIALALAGCNRRDDAPSTGQKVDAAIAKVDEKADAAKAEIARDAEKVNASAGQAMSDIKQAAGNAAQTSATAVQDTVITAGINAKLATDPDLKSLDIRVENLSGHATMRGTAPTVESQLRATQLAAAVNGVTSVDNQLTVSR